MGGLFLPLIRNSRCQAGDDLVKPVQLLWVGKKVAFPKMQVLLDVLLNGKLDRPA
jgi:hypothetical protein